MKSLNTYISESLLDTDFDDSQAYALIEEGLREWVEDVYDVKDYIIDLKTHTVNCDWDIRVKDKSIDRLMPEGWSWGEVDESFSCIGCENLKSLEGAPPKARDFICSGCKSLTNLIGGPLTVTQIFNCSGCDMLKDLTGAPRRLSGDFDCSDCKNLTTLKGAPKTVYRFICDHCDALKDIKDVPKIKEKLILPSHLR